MFHIVIVILFRVVYCNGAVTVPTIKFNDGNEIPAIALGTWLGNNTKGRIEPGSDEVEIAVSWAIDAGYRHIDTAYAYKIEDQLWNEFHARSAVVPALRKSLSDLCLEYVDLYLIHWPVGQFANKTYDYTDYLDTWRGMLDAKTLGLAKSVGLSNFNEQQMNRIIENGLEVPAVLQVEINLNLQQPTLLAYCKRHNITVMGYTPFGSLLHHKARPDAPPPRVDEPALQVLARKYEKTVPQVVLRYLIELGVIPSPKSLTKSRIEENIDVFDFSLGEEDRSLLKDYDRGYRTVPQTKWKDHPYYPF